MTLKTRIIPTMLCKGRQLVKGERFRNERVVGDAISACKVHDMREVDELCLLEVGGGRIDLDIVQTLAKACFMPLAVGGGVATVEDFGALLKGGADKVVLGSIAFERPDLVRKASQKHGAQAVVISIAYEAGGVDGKDAWAEPSTWAGWAEKLGAGEILLQSRERDGTLSGYDLEQIAAVSHAVSIPVIASGGCGSYEHMAEALRAGAHAVAAGAMFQFTEQTPRGAAQYLKDCGFNTRVAA